jgi:hypothetical protein
MPRNKEAGILSPSQRQAIKDRYAQPAPAPVVLKAQQGFKLSQLSRWWGWSDDTLRKYFKDVDGVGKIVHAEVLGKKSKRQYVSLRIPLHIAQAVYARLHPGSAVWFPPEDKEEAA